MPISRRVPVLGAPDATRLAAEGKHAPFARFAIVGHVRVDRFADDSTPLDTGVARHLIEIAPLCLGETNHEFFIRAALREDGRSRHRAVHDTRAPVASLRPRAHADGKHRPLAHVGHAIVNREFSAHQLGQ